MRIVHLPSSFTPDSVGGTETYVSTLAEALTARGHSCRIAWHTESTALPPDCVALPPRENADAIALHARALRQTPPGWAELLDEYRPDIVHFHAFTLGSGLDHARTLSRRGIPYVLTLHTPTMMCARGTWMKDGSAPCDGRIDPGRCARCVLPMRGVPRPAAAILGASPLPAQLTRLSRLAGPLAQPALLREFHRSFSEITAGASHLVACADFVRERLVSNGVAPNRISVLRQALPGSTRTRVLRSLPTSGRLKLGFFGRLTKDKGPDLLVAGARTLRSEGYDATVELAGPLARADEPWLTPWLEANRTFARHVGVLGGDRLLEWIATRDLIVIPSRCLETGPLALLEAWDANTPAIGTASGGIAEFMGSQGLSDHLFAVDDVAGLAATVRRLSRDARSVTVTVPGIDELVRSTQAIYERACSTSPPTSEPASG